MTIVGNKNMAKAIILFTTLIMAGCMMGPNFENPDLTAPETFRFAETVKKAEIDVNLKWWELFSDPILLSLVRTAILNNLDIKIAVSRIEEARATLGFTKADLYPMLNIEGSAQTGNFIGGGRSNSTDKTAYIAPVLSWEIDFWEQVPPVQRVCPCSLAGLRILASNNSDQPDCGSGQYLLPAAGLLAAAGAFQAHARFETG